MWTRRIDWRAGLVAMLLLLGWFTLRATRTTAASTRTAPPQALAEESPRGPASDATSEAARPLPLMPAGPTSAPVTAPHHPHPITATHQRIFRENNLLSALSGALDVRDAAGIRRLLAQYREEFPEDAHLVQDGYEVIANCLDQPSPNNQAAARRYYDEQLGSNIRRYVRRHCLE